MQTNRWFVMSVVLWGSAAACGNESESSDRTRTNNPSLSTQDETNTASKDHSTGDTSKDETPTETSGDTIDPSDTGDTNSDAGDPSDDPSNTTSDTSDETPEPPLPVVSYEHDVAPIFAQRCGGCHAAGRRNPQFMASSVAADQYNVLVAQTVAACGNAPLVKTGESNWETSYLAYKLQTKNPDAGECSPDNPASMANYSGVIMPPNGSMTADEIAVVLDWLAQGAQP